MSTAVGTNLHLGEHDEQELTSAFERSIANWHLYLFDGFGSFDPNVIYNRIEYLASGLECRVVFLDHLSILLSGLEGDERKMIDTTMTRLRSLVERTGISLFLVSHLRRSNNDRTSHEDFTALLKYQIKSLPSKEINRARLNEMSQLLESLRIVIQAKQVTLEK
jgi:twinkle protein